jgi:hypothetical protein
MKPLRNAPACHLKAWQRAARAVDSLIPTPGRDAHPRCGRNPKMDMLVCELCGSNAFTRRDEFYECDYCRTKYTAQDAQKVPNLLALANAAYEGENFPEAYEYANRALEIDAQNAAAWYLKGKAAGWLSTTMDVRLDEMLSAFRRAEDLTPEGEREQLRRDASLVLNDVAVTVYSLSIAQTREFVQVDGTWVAHILRCDEIVSTLEIAYEWGGSRSPLDNIVVVACELIQGIRFTSEKGVSSVVFLQPGYEAKIRSLIEATAVKLRTFDPSYATPVPHAQKPAGPCFVVTATMGSETAFPVVTLRAFRDEILTTWGPGREFVRWYARHGPTLANLIRDSITLRALTFVIVVAPSAAVAWLTLRLRRRHHRLSSTRLGSDE